MPGNRFLNDEIVIHGAREHNLTDVTVRMPAGPLVCITGLSGSGKSSLAFDTLYAEGQRRYVESLSAYARQFLGQMDKPDVDSHRRALAGDLDRPEDDVAQPALDGRHGHRDPRLPAAPVRAHRAPALPDLRPPDRGRSRPSRSSTRCWRCRRARASRVDAPLVRGRKGESPRRASRACAARASRACASTARSICSTRCRRSTRSTSTTSTVVVDRLVMKDDLRQRLTDSIETALRLGDGLVEVARGRRAGARVLRALRLPRARRLAGRAGAADVLVQLARTAPARPARASARRSRSTPSWSCPIRCSRSATARSRRGTSRRSSFFEQVLEAASPSAGRCRSTGRGASSRASSATLYLYGTGGERVYVTYKNRYGAQALVHDGFRGRRARTCSGAIARPVARPAAGRASRRSCRCARARPAAARVCGAEALAVTRRRHATSTELPRRAVARLRAPSWRRSSWATPSG